MENYPGLFILAFFFLAEKVDSLSLVPDILTYKTCADAPPSFSPGCMSNVTVYPGGRATFNCQVDPRCHIQYLRWFHEAPTGERRLLKTGRNATEPYVHTIEEVYEENYGRYFCIIGNVVGETECSAYLNVRNDAFPATSLRSTHHLLLWTMTLAFHTLIRWPL